MSLRRQATAVILLGLTVTSMTARAATSTNDALGTAAAVLACTLLASLLIEMQAGVRNIIRADIFMVAVLYGLTFAEFLFDQENLSTWLSLDDACDTIDVILCAFGGLVLGRHAFRMYAAAPPQDVPHGLHPSHVILLLVVCALLGYLHVLLAVNFDLADAVEHMMRPRFAQPWTRPRIGGLESLLNELGLLLYLVPPLAGAVLAEHCRYRVYQKFIALLVLGFTLFYGLASGTRYVILTYIVTFGASYLMLKRHLTMTSLIAVGAPLATASVLIVYYLAQIRTFGLNNWSAGVAQTERLFVDMNLLNIAGLIRAFPRLHDYLGLEIPFIAIVRPIPRFLWPGKPEGLSVRIEEVLGAQNWTLSATYLGELWMAGGLAAVIVASLAFGAAAAGWNQVGATAQGNLDKILYASGLFAAGICMRSFLGVMPAVLPTLALYLLRRWFSRWWMRPRARPF
jgi:oligosaccharide repeat unit polymerase